MNSDSVNIDYDRPPADSPPEPPQAFRLPEYPTDASEYILVLTISIVEGQPVGSLAWVAPVEVCPEPE